MNSRKGHIFYHETFSFLEVVLQEMNKESMANLNDDIAKLRVQVPNTIHPSNLI